MRDCIGNTRGCGCLALLIALALGFVAWQVGAQGATAVYIQRAITPGLILKQGAGVAWCSGCPEAAAQLGAQYWYGCCTTCPPINDNRVAIIRPDWQWSSDCPGDYAGYILMGNENEYNLTAQQMASWLIAERARYQDAIFVCFNSHDSEWIVSVMALLPDGVCQIIGVHVYDALLPHLDTVCDDCAIWITEMGQCYTGPISTQIFKDRVGAARADGRVKLILFYTTTGGVNPCLNGIDANGQLTAVGQAFHDAITGEVVYP